MRVLMLSKACVVGIYQKKLEIMARLAPDLELTVVVPPFWRDERGKIELERMHIDGYRLETQAVAFNGSFHLHYYPGLGSVIERTRPQLVHIDEEPYNLATYHANVVARRAGAKTLWFSWQNLHRRYPPPFSWIERYNLTHIDFALVGSESAGRVWRDKGYRGPLAVIPQFGVDPQVFHPPLEPRSERPVHIAYVGRLVAEKGCDVLLNALSRVRGEWRLTFAGSGPEEATLRSLAMALGLSGRVIFRPWVPSAQMPAFYRETDILVLPSRARRNWTEQFGRVLIEAMACQVAVVGSDVGEIPYVIGDAGLIFPEANVDALSEILARLIEDPGARRALGIQGRERVMASFTQRQIAAETIAVYRRLVS